LKMVAYPQMGVQNERYLFFWLQKFLPSLFLMIPANSLHFPAGREATQ
jgi:hypothetical protein